MDNEIANPARTLCEQVKSLRAAGVEVPLENVFEALRLINWITTKNVMMFILADSSKIEIRCYGEASAATQNFLNCANFYIVKGETHYLGDAVRSRAEARRIINETSMGIPV